MNKQWVQSKWYPSFSPVSPRQGSSESIWRQTGSIFITAAKKNHSTCRYYSAFGKSSLFVMNTHELVNWCLFLVLDLFLTRNNFWGLPKLDMEKIYFFWKTWLEKLRHFEINLTLVIYFIDFWWQVILYMSKFKNPIPKKTVLYIYNLYCIFLDSR